VWPPGVRGIHSQQGREAEQQRGTKGRAQVRRAKMVELRDTFCEGLICVEKRGQGKGRLNLLLYKAHGLGGDGHARRVCWCFASGHDQSRLLDPSQERPQERFLHQQACRTPLPLPQQRTRARARLPLKSFGSPFSTPLALGTATKRGMDNQSRRVQSAHLHAVLISLPSPCPHPKQRSTPPSLR
jgi:hypothetical protein